MSSEPGRRTTDLVVGLGAANATLVVVITDLVGRAVSRSMFGSGPTAALVLLLLSGCFLVISMVVSTSASVNTFAIAAAGQVRAIALRRLLGSTARAERRRLVRTGIRRAVPTIAVGAVGGYLLSTLAALVLTADDQDGLDLTAGDLLPTPWLVLPLLAQLGCVWWAAHHGSRGALDVRPAAALRAAASAETGDGAPIRPLRDRPQSMGLLWSGAALLALGAIGGAFTQLAVLPALAGGVLSIWGVLVSADRLVPPVVRLTARLLGRLDGLDLATRALLQHPVRTARASLGVALAVAVVTMFAVATATFEVALHGYYAGSVLAGEANAVIAGVVGTVSVLTGLAALTGAVGLANAVSFSTWLRRRDIALMRVLGQSRRQAERTITAESALLSLSATLLGLALGSVYGWVGTQSLLAHTVGRPVLAPAWPLLLVPAALLAALVLTHVASRRPARRALDGPPIRAYLDA